MVLFHLNFDYIFSTIMNTKMAYTIYKITLYDPSMSRGLSSMSKRGLYKMTYFYFTKWYPLSIQLSDFKFVHRFETST